MTEEEPVTGEEVIINIEAVRVQPIREDYGNLDPLVGSIMREGMRHPITVWHDGTLIDGARRLRAVYLADAVPGLPLFSIPAVFVSTVEQAAAAMTKAVADEYMAMPLPPSQMCRLWEMLRSLDVPNATRRAEAARRRGVQMRKATQAGKRAPGRNKQRTSDYVLGLACKPFGISEATASRLWAIYQLTRSEDVAPERREQAQVSLARLDAGEISIFAAYSAMLSNRPAPMPRPLPRTPQPAEPVAAIKQRTAWDRLLPQMEGMVAGLVDLGPPNPELSWEQVGPVHARLMRVRRDMEKVIKQMKEISKS